MALIGFIKADGLTQVANLLPGAAFKLLIPEKFGGKFVYDHYDDFGYVGHTPDGTPIYDALELLAFWNAKKSNTTLKYYGKEFPLMKPIDDYTFINRQEGIKLITDPKLFKKLKYPLKIVSASYKGTYEICEGFSLLDPKAASSPLTWKEAEEEKVKFK